MKTLKIYRSAVNAGVWVERTFTNEPNIPAPASLIKHGDEAEIGEAPFIDLEVFGYFENAILIYRESINDPFTVVLRCADGHVNGTMKVSGIRVVA